MRFLVSRKRGFTLIEVLTTILILSILASVFLHSGAEARKNARDKQRIADLEQLQLAFRLYREVNGSYPDCASGIKIGVSHTINGNSCNIHNIDTLLSPYYPTLPKDPLSGTINYEYYYDSAFNCDGDTNIIIYAQTMEAMQSPNTKWRGKKTVCGTVVNGKAKSNNSYGIILK